MSPIEKALILGRALGLAEGGWPNDCLDVLEPFPELKQEVITYIQTAALCGKYGLETPLRTIIQRELNITIKE